MSASPPETFVLDSGALIALDSSDRMMTGLLRKVRGGHAQFIVPDGVTAQVWRTGGRQALTAALLALKPPQCLRVPLDTEAAKRIGMRIGECGHPDVVDVHVALLAGDHGAAVVTSDRADILTVAPELRELVQDI